ncbi:GNAT family acetyltransferase [Pochonia chlamydosporia 170]|uniref:GNAT family acetyltransferase n=1 Tax=Pochonia chlamydosporia 170 TaxID=1380566 RepID=A0A179FN41_METCM|nr:GNAT family acetyltransferase [Pochonia chlamydosporia 170]OAQ66571.1 GNAT family acetyltransferase [Pochonia chlamydosporia 170]
MSKPTYTITGVRLEDVPEIGRLSADAFVNDRQTQMKNLGKEPYDMNKITLESLPGLLHNPRCIAIKVVDSESGEIMGVCNWGFRGFKPEEMPKVEGKPLPLDKPAETPAKSEDAQDSQEKNQQYATDGKGRENIKEDEESDPIKRLQALTGGDLEAWMEEVMPEGTRCLFIVGLSVSPKFQGRGVGSTLLRWGTDICDDKGVFAWVHSSEPAWPMYEKCGFQVIRCLDIDLDEYAPVPPPNEGPDAKWGHYVFRYMKYFGKQKEAQDTT